MSRLTVVAVEQQDIAGHVLSTSVCESRDDRPGFRISSGRMASWSSYPAGRWKATASLLVRRAGDGDRGTDFDESSELLVGGQARYRGLVTGVPSPHQHTLGVGN
jgi:hypothetical protein